MQQHAVRGVQLTEPLESPWPMSTMRTLAGCVCLWAFLPLGCSPIEQRYFYRTAIEQFSAKLPKAGTKCWLTPDLVGPSQGSNAIAEEEFINFLLSKGLCEVVEKHPDVLAGYNWPKEDTVGKDLAGSVASSSLGLPSIGAPVAADGNDNDRSRDRLLERFKKRTLPLKVIVYRIDDLKDDAAVIWFRISDARTAIVEASQTVLVRRVYAPAPAASD